MSFSILAVSLVDRPSTTSRSRGTPGLQPIQGRAALGELGCRDQVLRAFKLDLTVKVKKLRFGRNR